MGVEITVNAKLAPSSVGVGAGPELGNILHINKNGILTNFLNWTNDSKVSYSYRIRAVNVS